MLLNMKDLLAVANEHKFAVPAFNISDYSMLNGIFEAAEEKRSPIIVAIHPDELAHLGGEALKAVIEKAEKASVPVCIHLDHGSDFAQIIQAIQLGFTSVMIDGSALPFEDNIAITKKVTEAAHHANVSVEGELGTIGTADSEGEAGANEIIYTDPDDAATFVAETKVDALAIAIGTSHGSIPKAWCPNCSWTCFKKSKPSCPSPWFSMVVQATPMTISAGRWSWA